MKQHGMSDTPIYLAWSNMLQRCENPNHPSYRRYGGRGVKVCNRWHDFRNFYADMGDKPNKNLTLERLDNSEGYEASNCCWATRKQQANNIEFCESILLETDKKRSFVAFNVGSGEWEISDNYKKFAKDRRLNIRTVIACLHSSRIGNSQTYKGWEFGFLD